MTLFFVNNAESPYYQSAAFGKKKEINIHWKDVDTRGETPKVVISGYNVE